MSSQGLRVSTDEFAALLRAKPGNARQLIAVAGPPGAGKSTLAERLKSLLDAQGESAAVLPMDGYHFDDGVLEELGLRKRKGAPETFDVGGLRSILDRLRRNDEDLVAVPVFDRDVEIARAGARLIPSSVRYLIVEGNYLLLDQGPWSNLRSFFDVTSMLRPSIGVLRQRLIQRWKAYQLPPEQIAAKVEENDLPNAKVVLEHSASADFYIVG